MSDTDAEHRELRVLVGRARSAASSRDWRRLRREASRLLATFGKHVDAERMDFVRRGPRIAAIALRSQQRLLRDIIALAVESEAPEPCQCERLAAHVEAMLAAQVERERRLIATADAYDDGRPRRRSASRAA
jgi:hypothetical protein